MRYTPEIFRTYFRTPKEVRVRFAEDCHEMMKDYLKTGSWWKSECKFVIRMFLDEKFVWTYSGGTNIVAMDKDRCRTMDYTTWKQKIQNAYEVITEKTNRKMFGRRYFRKRLYPVSFVFFERGNKTEGKHIHTLHHFPSQTIEKADDYIQSFQKSWIDHDLNNPVGRTFWYEGVGNDVASQSRKTRYATKKMGEDYETGWFVSM